MKRLILFSLAVLFTMGTYNFAQDPDTTKVRIGKKGYTIIVDDDKEVRIITDDDIVLNDDVTVTHKVHKKKKPQKMNGTWDGMEFGFSNFTNPDYTLDLPAGAGFMEPKMLN